MPTAAKQAVIEALITELSQTSSVIVTDYRGLTVDEITKLRRKLRTVGAEYKVVKNTLLKRALPESGLPVMEDLLEGPNAIMVTTGDPVIATKTLTTFAKELKKDFPSIKGGLLGTQQLSAAQVIELSKLPSREEILGNLVGTIQTPVTNTVMTIGAVMQNLIGTIEAYHNDKSAA